MATRTSTRAAAATAAANKTDKTDKPDDMPDRAMFTVTAVWPDGRMEQREATARELHTARDTWERGGALVVIAHTRVEKKARKPHDDPGGRKLGAKDTDADADDE